MDLSVEADITEATSQTDSVSSDIQQQEPDTSSASSQGIPLYDVLGFPFLPDRYQRMFDEIPIRLILDKMTKDARDRMQRPVAL